MEFIEKDKEPGCVFCQVVKEKNDRDNLVLHRFDNAFVILNKYPYNIGHLMVVPFEHTHDFASLSKSNSSSLMEHTQACVRLLHEVYKASGYNIGMNLGTAGGAGIKEHLHVHIVPRWIGDTNFMPVLADAKSMPQHLLESYDRLKQGRCL